MILSTLMRLVDIPTFLLAYILFYLTSLLPLDNPLTTLIFLFFVSYIGAFLVSRYLQKTGSVTNPFRYALSRTPHVAIAMIFIFLPSFILFFNIPLGIIALLLWMPLSLPLLAATAIEKMPGRDIVYEALLAGKHFYFRILLSLIVGLLFYIPFFYLSFLSPPYTSPLNTVFTFLYLTSLSLEAYIRFREG